MTDKDKLLKLRKLADVMYYAAQYLTTDASKLHKAMDEYHQFIIHEYHKEEPVSIDFEQELYKAFGQVKDFTLGMRIAKWFYAMGKNSPETVSEDLEEASKNYALNNTPWDDCKDEIQESFKAGAKWKEQQLMSKAVDAHCFGFQGAALFSFRLPADKYLVGSKVKVIVIKED